MMLALILGTLVYAGNAELFEFVDRHSNQGYEWQYTGQRQCEVSEPCLPVIHPLTGDRLTFYMLTKP